MSSGGRKPDQGNGGRGKHPPAPDAQSAPISIDEIIDHGLENFRQGEILAAMSEWEHALALDPDCVRAKAYIKYVEDNFDLISERFRSADADEANDDHSVDLDPSFGIESLDDDAPAIDLPEPSPPAPPTGPTDHDGWPLGTGYAAAPDPNGPGARKPDASRLAEVLPPPEDDDVLAMAGVLARSKRTSTRGVNPDAADDGAGRGEPSGGIGSSEPAVPGGDSPAGGRASIAPRQRVHSPGAIPATDSNIVSRRRTPDPDLDDEKTIERRDFGRGRRPSRLNDELTPLPELPGEGGLSVGADPELDDAWTLDMGLDASSWGAPSSAPELPAAPKSDLLPGLPPPPTLDPAPASDPPPLRRTPTGGASTADFNEVHAINELEVEALTGPHRLPEDVSPLVIAELRPRDDETRRDTEPGDVGDPDGWRAPRAASPGPTGQPSRAPSQPGFQPGGRHPTGKRGAPPAPASGEELPPPGVGDLELGRYDGSNPAIDLAGLERAPTMPDPDANRTLPAVPSSRSQTLTGPPGADRATPDVPPGLSEGASEVAAAGVRGGEPRRAWSARTPVSRSPALDATLPGDTPARATATGATGRRTGAGSASTSFPELAPLEGLVSELLDDLDVDAPPGESERARLRRRVATLIERGKREHAAGNSELAVLALDLAVAEEPDSAITQKLIQLDRDAICEIYQSYIGDVGALPTVAIDMADLASESIDTRAVFLLSRIDGILSVDELLDVSGMPRLEAYRHLAMMVLKGILQLG